MHEFKCKNGGFFWYWLGFYYFGIYHVLLIYVVFRHPAPYLYDCYYNETSSSFVCRDDCPDFGIPLKNDASGYWNTDHNSCYNEWYGSYHPSLGLFGC